jgi:hypothetical protein
MFIEESMNGDSQFLTKIRGIRDEIKTAGAVDSETDQIENIIARLTNNEVDGETALSEAQAIQASRNDYH